ncbi:hypothetical protein J8I29_23925 [Labrys sp. LIt4]|uniref:Uncharacterized protein n=1 Tax=Labrys okinawensis TaxID=346911 RepID=A0A2S9QA26_9HYPH|nr:MULTISPECIES: hypothetical protein [Labrys]MBP0582396.1 hypothetical protein [Labrys sp. LIt4]PRH86184.1 hypothetical protein C5L14_18225 [Labrys okinawensis]
MAKTPYQPPEQSALGQIVDSIVLLALVVASLFAPIALGLAGGGKTDIDFADKSWTGMGQSSLAQALWEKLGYTAETAAPIIASRFDYSFSLPAFLLTAAIIVIYFGFLIYYSDKEYRDVIAERFDDK